jgi:hypothetical protein
MPVRLKCSKVSAPGHLSSKRRDEPKRTHGAATAATPARGKFGCTQQLSVSACTALTLPCSVPSTMLLLLLLLSGCAQQLHALVLQST